MRVIQFEVPTAGRRVGVVDGQRVYDLTATNPQWRRVVEIFHDAQRQAVAFEEVVGKALERAERWDGEYQQLLDAAPDTNRAFLHPPLDAIDDRQVMITGTGLTHLGSMQSRDEMHTSSKSEEPVTDSRKMFLMGLEKGKPHAGQRGAAPEWFYKGDGQNLRGHNQQLEIPSFARDGGEEPEVVGCYVIDPEGAPRRLGFAIGNEWSDHETERINYLYLAPSKLRTCAIGPELTTNVEFDDIAIQCEVERDSQRIYASGPLFSGEQHMCHSLANCEDHHFKYPQHRRPGDIHLHFFGTSKLSYGDRDWKYQSGDVIRIHCPALGADLVNVVRAEPAAASPIRVHKA